MHASVVAQLPAGGQLAVRISSHARAGATAHVPHALLGLRSLTAHLPANIAANCQSPAAVCSRLAGLSCNNVASPSASRLLVACQQAFATSALSPSQRQRRQRQSDRLAALAVLEQQPAVEAGSSTAAGGSAQPSAASYVVVNFYHLADISDPKQVTARACVSAMQCEHPHLIGNMTHPALHNVTAKTRWLDTRRRSSHVGCAERQVYRQHRAALNGLDVRGRIYISPQGINAQYSGPEADAVQYAQWVEQQPEFQVHHD